MRFEFYSEAIDASPKLSVDGTVPNSIHFSHWEGNTTPPEVKADTSTEIALNLVASPRRTALTNNIELVTNNHFDTDGVLSVWTVLTGERALEYRDLLVAAAEAGDFSEYSTMNGIRVSLALQGTDQASPTDDPGSPLAGFIAGGHAESEEETYALVLPKVEQLLKNINDYEPLWRDGWRKIAGAVESFELGTSKVIEFPESKLSLITLAPDLFDGGGFRPTKHSAPYTAISKFARGQLFVIGIPATDGWFYRIDYPYYSWAETVIRPRIARRDWTSALLLLNEKEKKSHGTWQTDTNEMTSAVKFLDRQRTLVPSSLDPEVVAGVLRQALAFASAV
jgi:hypothetical protein